MQKGDSITHDGGLDITMEPIWETTSETLYQIFDQRKMHVCMYEVNNITISYQLIIETNNSNTKYKELISRIIITNVLYISEDLPEIVPIVYY